MHCGQRQLLYYLLAKRKVSIIYFEPKDLDLKVSIVSIARWLYSCQGRTLAAIPSLYHTLAGFRTLWKAPHGPLGLGQTFSYIVNQRSLLHLRNW